MNADIILPVWGNADPPVLDAGSRNVSAGSSPVTGTMTFCMNGTKMQK